MIAVFYLANLIFGFIIILPLRAIIDDFVGYSLVGEELANRFDMDFLFELLVHRESFIPTVSGLIFIVPVVYWLVLLFLSGGAFAIFASAENYSAKLFWGSCGKYFGRYLRLALWSLPMLAILLAVPFLVKGLQWLILGRDPYEYFIYWAGWLRTVLGFAAILTFGIIFDYARIYTVRTDENRMRVSLWQGFRFALGNFKYTFGLAGLLFLAGGLILAIYYPISNSLSTPSIIVVALLFLTQQLYMTVRMMLRLTSYSSQLQIHRSLHEQPAVAYEPPVDPLTVEGAAA
jgi:hypothetical protein